MIKERMRIKHRDNDEIINACEVFTSKEETKKGIEMTARNKAHWKSEDRSLTLSNLSTPKKQFQTANDLKHETVKSRSYDE